MNDLVLPLTQPEREKLGRLVDHFMVSEREVVALLIEEGYMNHIIVPNKKTPYDTEEEALESAD